MKIYGLIGKNLSHSFSTTYFKEKILKEKITDTEYLNFELEDITDFPQLIATKNISGLNITIPYKESIIPYLDALTEDAKAIGAVNTIEFKSNKLIGHNTDVIGFSKSITPILKGRKKALILGSGGGAKAVNHVLKKLNIDCKTVSRNSLFDYSDITAQITGYYDLIINTTPLGMFPNTESYPKILYEALTESHLLFDLIYNPSETLFLKYGKANKSCVKNGLEMLQIQAETSWNIWNT